MSNKNALPMPFTGESENKLQGILNSIIKCDLPVEVFDAFLYSYKKTGDIDKSLFFALREWDC